MKRLTDIVVVLCGLVICLLPMALIAIAVRLTSPGPAFYRSPRIGQHGVQFMMLKFRTMRADTPNVASHELSDADAWMTPIGQVLRKTSLDEIPQLLCILRGEMSLVGPRPALFNQTDLIALRKQRGIDRLVPGLTGWAQVNGRDALTVAQKVAFDAEYLTRQSWGFDLWILVLTVPKVLGGRNIKH